MEVHNSDNKFSRVTGALMVAFAISLLFSLYVAFTLPADLRFKGNVQYLDLVTPILVKLYIALGFTVLLAIAVIYAEMKNVKVAIIYKDKSAAQVKEEKMQAESTRLDSLDTKSISASNPDELLTKSLNHLAKHFDGVAGACYICKNENGNRFAELISGFALPLTESDTIRFNYGEGMVGQSAKSGTPVYMDDIPEGYFQGMSGLGQASPRFILILPLKKGVEVWGVLEVATFYAFNPQQKQLAEKFAAEIGERLS